MSGAGLHYAFVESNTTGTGRRAIHRLLADGHCVTFLTRQPERYPFLAEIAGSLQVVVTDTNEIEALTSRVQTLCSHSRVDGVLTFSTFYVQTVAELASWLGFPYLNQESAQLCHQKDQTRRALVKAGLPVPLFRRVDSEVEVVQAAREIGFPCVMKPIADSGSTGVRLLQNVEELLVHYRNIAANVVNDRGQPASKGALIEALLEGPEFSVETITLGRSNTRVVGMTAKYLSPPPFFVEIGHDFPADVGVRELELLKTSAVAALDAVGYDWGPAHTEIRMTASGPVVVEINPRLAGGMIPELVRYAFGVDLLGVVLDGVVGKVPQLAPTRSDFAAIRFLTADRVGWFEGPPRLEAAVRVPLIKEVIFERGSGLTRPPENASDRLGYVIASGPGRSDVIDAINKALSYIALPIKR